MNHDADGPAVITSARVSLSDDIRRRQSKYLISMAVRTVCFVLAFVTTGPVRWVFIAAALVLPYIAVVVANVGTSREVAAPPAFVDDAHALPGPRA